MGAAVLRTRVKICGITTEEDQGPEVAGNPGLVILVVALVYAPRIARMARICTGDVCVRSRRPSGK